MITFKQKLTAIKGSIEKWDKVSRREIEDKGEDNCSLCQLYYNTESFKIRCSGCPIYEKTGKTHCMGTPYGDYGKSCEREELYGSTYLKHTTDAAAEEFRDWLKDLYIEVSEAGDGAPKAPCYVYAGSDLEGSGTYPKDSIDKRFEDTQKLSRRIANLIPAIGSNNRNITELTKRIEKLEDRKIYFTTVDDKPIK